MKFEQCRVISVRILLLLFTLASMSSSRTLTQLPSSSNTTTAAKTGSKSLSYEPSHSRSVSTSISHRSREQSESHSWTPTSSNQQSKSKSVSEQHSLSQSLTSSVLLVTATTTISPTNTTVLSASLSFTHDQSKSWTVSSTPASSKSRSSSMTAGTRSPSLSSSVTLSQRTPSRSPSSSRTPSNSSSDTITFSSEQSGSASVTVSTSIDRSASRSISATYDDSRTDSCTRSSSLSLLPSPTASPSMTNNVTVSFTPTVTASLSALITRSKSVPLTKNTMIVLDTYSASATVVPAEDRTWSPATIVGSSAVLLSMAVSVAIEGGSASSLIIQQVILSQASVCPESLSRSSVVKWAALDLARFKESGINQYTISPFWDLGFLVAAFANLAFLVCGLWLHASVTLWTRTRLAEERRSQLIEQNPLMTEEELDEKERYDRRHQLGIRRSWRAVMMQAASKWRFPSFFLRIAEILLPGCVFCSVGYFYEANEKDTNNGYSSAMIFLSVLLTFVFWQATLYLLIRPCIIWSPHHHPLHMQHLLSYPKHMEIKWRFLVPSEYWEPKEMRASFGEMFNSVRKPFVLLRILEPVSISTMGAASALATYGPGVGCAAASIFLGLLCVSIALFVMIRRPFRLPLCNAIAPVQQTIFAVTSFVKVRNISTPAWVMIVQCCINILLLCYLFWCRAEEHKMMADASMRGDHVKVSECFEDEELTFGPPSLPPVMPSQDEGDDEHDFKTEPMPSLPQDHLFAPEQPQRPLLVETNPMPSLHDMRSQQPPPNHVISNLIMSWTPQHAVDPTDELSSKQDKPPPEHTDSRSALVNIDML